MKRLLSEIWIRSYRATKPPSSYRAYVSPESTAEAFAVETYSKDGAKLQSYRLEIPPDRRFCRWTADNSLLNDDPIYYAAECRGDEPGPSGYPWHYYALTPRELKPLTDDERRDAAKIRFNYGR